MTPQIYSGLPKTSQINIASNNLVSVICKRTGVTLEDVRSRSRIENVIKARALICGLHKADTHELSEILNKDRTTIYYYIKLFSDLKYSDKGFKEIADSIINNDDKIDYQ